MLVMKFSITRQEKQNGDVRLHACIAEMKVMSASKRTRVGERKVKREKSEYEINGRRQSYKNLEKRIEHRLHKI